MPESVFMNVKKWQYVRENKTRFTTKFIQNMANRPYKIWASLVKLADEICWDKMELELASPVR